MDPFNILKEDKLKVNWGGLLRVVGPKLVGLAAGALSGWIYTKTAGAITLDPAGMEKLVGLIVTMSGSATAVTKIHEAYVNPVGAPSPIVAQAGVAVKEEATTNAEAEDGKSK